MLAVNNLLENSDPSHAALFSRLLETEQDPAVREAMESGLAVARLSDPDPVVRLAATEDVAGSLAQPVRNRLTAMAAAEVLRATSAMSAAGRSVPR